MNLTDEQRAELQRRYADARSALASYGVTVLPAPAHPLLDHEAAALVEWEEHRVRLERDDSLLRYRATPTTVRVPTSSRPSRAKPIGPRTCGICGITFTPRYSQQKYHNVRCANEAERRRRRRPHEEHAA